MAHKTLTISEEAYQSLSRLKKNSESFTRVILRLTKQNEVGTLSEYIKTVEPDEELARSIEQASRRLRSLRLQRVKL